MSDIDKSLYCDLLPCYRVKYKPTIYQQIIHFIERILNKFWNYTPKSYNGTLE